MEIPKWFKGDPDKFTFRLCTIGGDDCVLIKPKPEMEGFWDEDNKIYRSSIWRLEDGYPVSLGYKKFVNYNELPAFEIPENTELGKFEAVEKIDGTCVIISKYKGELIVRTRGTVDAHIHPNSDDLFRLIDELKLWSVGLHPDTWGVSFIFEWVTPSNAIVLQYPKSKLFLTGMVKHSDYSYYEQSDLDFYARMYKWDRPERMLKDEYDKLFGFNKGTWKEACALWTHFMTDHRKCEGYVLYFDRGQVLKKLKTGWYLVAHSLRFSGNYTKSLIATLTCFNHLDSKKDYTEEEFIEVVRKYRDHEYVETSKPQILDVLRIYKEHVLKPMTQAKEYLDKKENKDYKAVLETIDEHPEIDKFIFWTVSKNKRLPEFRINSIILKEFKKNPLQISNTKYNNTENN